LIQRIDVEVKDKK